ncbi:MAG: hypothetical protein FWE80_10045 [Oscillospiraceae bacterium]|nr:hypothetical protein [Oscillospiraceae bacterium]
MADTEYMQAAGDAGAAGGNSKEEFLKKVKALMVMKDRLTKENNDLKEQLGSERANYMSLNQRLETVAGENAVIKNQLAARAETGGADTAALREQLVSAQKSFDLMKERLEAGQTDYHNVRSQLEDERESASKLQEKINELSGRLNAAQERTAAAQAEAQMLQAETVAAQAEAKTAAAAAKAEAQAAAALAQAEAQAAVAAAQAEIQAARTAAAISAQTAIPPVMPSFTQVAPPASPPAYFTPQAVQPPQWNQQMFNQSSLQDVLNQPLPTGAPNSSMDDIRTVIGQMFIEAQTKAQTMMQENERRADRTKAAALAISEDINMIAAELERTKAALAANINAINEKLAMARMNIQNAAQNA